MDSNTPFTFNLLLSTFFMLLPHMHNSGCFRSIAFITMHTLEIFRNLVGGTSVLPGFSSIIATLLAFLILAHIGGVSTDRPIVCHWLQLTLVVGVRLVFSPHRCKLTSFASRIVIFLFEQLWLHLDHFLLNLQIALVQVIKFYMRSELIIALRILSDFSNLPQFITRTDHWPDITTFE